MATDMKISELFDIRSRFLRSVHLERDFEDPDILREYILGGHSRDCLQRIAKGLEDRSGLRAWRITGDYGTGKSSFALFLAHWFSGNADLFPPSFGETAAYSKYTDRIPRFVPVLVTGSRAPLGPAILKALRDCLDSVRTNGKNRMFMVRFSTNNTKVW